MRIRRKFLQLTSNTFPFGTESYLTKYLPNGYQTDQFGNFYFLIGDNPQTMFTCHLDTACANKEKVSHIQNGNIISTDGKTILGADDKAGMVVLLYMIEKKVPGLYYFFLGEEVGCVGSGKVAEVWSDNQFSKTINKVISFDRRGTNSVITEQWYGVCCSDEFAVELSNRLNNCDESFNFSPDDTGIFTDSAKFMSLVPECTNISVGYNLEHTHKEYQDIEFLQRLCKAVCKIDWETLPIKRNAKDDDFYDGEDDDDSEELEFSSRYFSYFKHGQGTKKFYIAKSLIEKEKKTLESWIINQGYSQDSKVIWNGNSLNVETAGKVEFISNRFDLIQFIPDLSQVPTRFLSDKIEDKKVLL